MGRDFPPVQTGPGAHPASCTMGTGSFPGVNYGRGVLLTTHLLLVSRSWKSRAIPLPTLWVTTGPVTGFLYLTCQRFVSNRSQMYCHSYTLKLPAPAMPMNLTGVTQTSSILDNLFKNPLPTTFVRQIAKNIQIPKLSSTLVNKSN